MFGPPAGYFADKLIWAGGAQQLCLESKERRWLGRLVFTSWRARCPGLQFSVSIGIPYAILLMKVWQLAGVCRARWDAFAPPLHACRCCLHRSDRHRVSLRLDVSRHTGAVHWA